MTRDQLALAIYNAVLKSSVEPGGPYMDTFSMDDCFGVAIDGRFDLGIMADELAKSVSRSKPHMVGREFGWFDVADQRDGD